MRVLAHLLWAGAALETCSVSAQALLYTSEQVSASSTDGPPSIAPTIARLLLAQRLGLSAYHSLEGADDSTLEALNVYGGGQQRVFEDNEQTEDKLLLIIEGARKPEDILGAFRKPALFIDGQPTSSENLDLAQTLLEQDRHRRSLIGRSGSLQFPKTSALQGGVSVSTKVPDDHSKIFQLEKPRLSDYTSLLRRNGLTGRGHTTILHDTSLQSLQTKDGGRYAAAVSDLQDAVQYILGLDNLSSTIVIMPTPPKTAKRSNTTPYGTYAKPLTARQQQPEEPLTSPSSPSKQQPSAPEILQASATPLPHGILPVCHSTLESAIAATNNCSGHGTAYQKSGGETDCFACRCSKTVLTADNGGVKTIYWGGPACQKKDISVPFFLLAGLTIALAGAATWGVGLMVSIGQEELPSVIGAGVTGPRAQK